MHPKRCMKLRTLSCSANAVGLFTFCVGAGHVLSSMVCIVLVGASGRLLVLVRAFVRACSQLRDDGVWVCGCVCLLGCVWICVWGYGGVWV